MSKINNIRNVHRKLKLKTMKEQKKKSKKSADKRETIQKTDAVLKKNIRTEGSENDLTNTKSNHTGHSSNTSIEINEEYGSGQNPIEDSRLLLEWLLYPMSVETFFEWVENW